MRERMAEVVVCGGLVCGVTVIESFAFLVLPRLHMLQNPTHTDLTHTTTHTLHRDTPHCLPQELWRVGPCLAKTKP